MNQDIYFYSRKAEYGWLSNYWRAVEVVDGQTYPTNENYYQAQKALDHHVITWIAIAPRPRWAKLIGDNLTPGEMRSDWDHVRVGIMYTGLIAKFTQNEVLKQWLLDTGSRGLHEDSPTDKFWGVKGEDMLGRLLVRVREELREGKHV